MFCTSTLYKKTNRPFTTNTIKFEIIVDKSKNSSLGEKFYEEADSYLGFVSDKLDISKRASAIMALFAERCDDSHIQFSDFTDFLGCRILSLLRYANEIQELVYKEYICRNRDEGFYYTIPMMSSSPLTTKSVQNKTKSGKYISSVSTS